MLSQKRPLNEVRIDDANVVIANSEIPDNTFAYTTLEPYVMNFDKSVIVDSFWMRLHTSGEFY